MSTGKYFEFDGTSGPNSYHVMVIPPEKLVVIFPSHPDEWLHSFACPQRLRHILERSAEHGALIDWLHWKSYEVLPDADRLYMRENKFLTIREHYFRKYYRWDDTLSAQFDFTYLDKVSGTYGLPTIGDYYANVQADRVARKAREKESLKMLTSWIFEYKSTAALLNRLHHDFTHNLDRVRDCKWGWHYIHHMGNEEHYYRTPNAETLLKSFIYHAESCFRLDIPVRFSYCSPQDTSAKEFLLSPIQE